MSELPNRYPDLLNRYILEQKILSNTEIYKQLATFKYNNWATIFLGALFDKPSFAQININLVPNRTTLKVQSLYDSTQEIITTNTLYSQLVTGFVRSDYQLSLQSQTRESNFYLALPTETTILTADLTSTISSAFNQFGLPLTDKPTVTFEMLYDKLIMLS